MLLFLLDGLLLLRCADRQLFALLFQFPPGLTRFEPAYPAPPSGDRSFALRWRAGLRPALDCRTVSVTTLLPQPECRCPAQADRMSARRPSLHHLEAPVFIAKPRAAPRPLAWLERQVRFDRIVLDVTPRASLLRLIAHVGVPVVFVPKLTRPAQDAVGLLGGVGFPTAHHLAQRHVRLCE